MPRKQAGTAPAEAPKEAPKPKPKPKAKHADPQPPKDELSPEARELMNKLSRIARELAHINVVKKKTDLHKKQAYELKKEWADLDIPHYESLYDNSEIHKMVGTIETLSQQVYKPSGAIHEYVKQRQEQDKKLYEEDQEKIRQKRIKEGEKSLAIEEHRLNILGIRQHGEDEKLTAGEVSRYVAENEEQIKGPDSDQKKVEFYNIMEASGGLDKNIAHEKKIEILTKSGKEQYATGNLNKPINPAIDPKSIKMQKFNETLNIVTARPIAIKNAPHYEHPSHKLKMALKNFNTA